MPHDLAILKCDISRLGEKQSHDIRMTELSLWQNLLKGSHYIVLYCLLLNMINHSPNLELK